MTTREQFLDRTLEGRWEKFCCRLEECRLESNGETVRKLRIALRKLVTHIDAALRVVDCTSGQNAKARLKREMKVVGRLRDVQMQRNRLQSLHFKSEGVEELAGWLQRKEKKLLDRIGPSLADLKLRKTHAQVCKTAAKVRKALAKSGQAPEETRQRLLAQTFRQVLRRYRALDLRDLDTIHDLRIAFKKFRYLKEALAPDQKQAHAVSPLKQYQDKLGEVQDWEVLLKTVHKYCNRQGVGTFRKLTTLRSRILKERDAAVRKFWQARADVLQWKGEA